MRQIRCVVFDLDGTLIDSAPDLRRALNKLLAEEQRPALALDAVVGMIGDGAMKLVERAFTATGGIGKHQDIPGLTKRFLAHYEGYAAEDTMTYPGVMETLAGLRANGMVLGICTNKPAAPTHEILREFGLSSTFAAVFGGDSLPGIRKPDPRLLTAVLDALGCGAAEAVMVGDNANDVGVARAAGVPVVVRAGGYTSVPAVDLGADAVIESFDQLPAALARL
ncbi:MAG: phosphoglycolate phosphatase [Rhodospirillales bacterium]|nr:phosphoglycolate phosphatase [Rhodospirillales bacterium]